MDNTLTDISLTATQIQILQSLPFGNTTPGTLVKDFNSLLDFIRTQGVAVSEKTQLFTLNILTELNLLLSHPLDMKLKRPVQKSFPHINGLYLLLRCSGLSYLKLDGKKLKLMLHEAQLADWRALNPTERYFFLLQAFYYRADAEILSERNGFGMPSCFFYCLDFFRQHLDVEFDVKNNRYGLEHLRYIPGYYNLALMELFGFIDVECAVSSEKETWNLTKIRATNWGRIVFGYFVQHHKARSFFDFDESPDKIPTNSWEAEFKKHIPAWQNSLREIEYPITAEGTFIFKVSLGKAVCKLAVPAGISLDELADGILAAFDFDNDHLYEFVYKNQYGIEKSIGHPYMDTEYDLATDICKVGALPLYKGMNLIFHFDFGDDWEFLISVESLPSPDIQFSGLTIMEKSGTPPKQYPGWEEDD